MVLLVQLRVEKNSRHTYTSSAEILSVRFVKTHNCQALRFLFTLRRSSVTHCKRSILDSYSQKLNTFHLF